MACLDTNFIGANLDLWNTEKTLVQFTYAHAFNVTDGFDGLTVFQTNPLTGETGLPPAILRFTPTNEPGFNRPGRTCSSSGTKGALICLQTSMRTGSTPSTSPDLLADSGRIRLAFRSTTMGTCFMQALATTSPNDRTKTGFEFNHGSKYWFNFAQAQDDIIMPKTSTRGNVYEAYLTHRINPALHRQGGLHPL